MKTTNKVDYSAFNTRLNIENNKNEKIKNNSKNFFREVTKDEYEKIINNKKIQKEKIKNLINEEIEKNKKWKETIKSKYPSLNIMKKKIQEIKNNNPSLKNSNSYPNYGSTHSDIGYRPIFSSRRSIPKPYNHYDNLYNNNGINPFNNDILNQYSNTNPFRNDILNQNNNPLRNDILNHNRQNSDNQNNNNPLRNDISNQIGQSRQNSDNQNNSDEELKFPVNKYFSVKEYKKD